MNEKNERSCWMASAIKQSVFLSRVKTNFMYYYYIVNDPNDFKHVIKSTLR